MWFKYSSTALHYLTQIIMLYFILAQIRYYGDSFTPPPPRKIKRNYQTNYLWGEELKVTTILKLYIS